MGDAYTRNDRVRERRLIDNLLRRHYALVMLEFKKSPEELVARTLDRWEYERLNKS